MNDPIESRETCCNSRCLLIIFILFLIIAFLMFIPGYLVTSNITAAYKNATCYIAEGRVDHWQCRVNGCHDCYQDCWETYTAISAVPGVMVYQYYATFLSAEAAVYFADRNVGKSLGPCFYTDGGKTIRYELPNPLGFLITGIVFAVLSVICLSWWPIAYGKGLVTECCGNHLLKINNCCRRRRRGYSELDAVPVTDVSSNQTEPQPL